MKPYFKKTYKVFNDNSDKNELIRKTNGMETLNIIQAKLIQILPFTFATKAGKKCDFRLNFVYNAKILSTDQLICACSISL